MSSQMPRIRIDSSMREHRTIRCLIALCSVSGRLLKTQFIDLLRLPDWVNEGWELICIDPEDEEKDEQAND